MAVSGTSTTEYETRTEGKSVGPITKNIGLAGTLATLLVFISTAVGFPIPADVALAAATLLFAGIAWYSKSRVKVVETHVLDAVPDGTGQHRAEQPLGENNE